MAEESDDDSQRTEEPTQKKLSDARERGEVPRSSDVTAFITLSAATFAIVLWGGDIAQNFVKQFTGFIAHPEAMGADGGSIQRLAWIAAGALGAILALPLGLMFIAGIAGNVLQAPVVLSGEKMKLDLAKLSPGKGFSRLFGGESLVNFGKGLIKVIATGAAGCIAVWPDHDQLIALVATDPRAMAAATLAMTTKALGAMLGVIALFAAIDWFWQRMSFMRRMRMSKQEIKDENKQQEGDPLIKMKIRQIRMERGRKRMMANVPKATVIITNPTHYAVALQYESGAMAAPKCVAKGVDALALRIREIAGQHKVPIVENPPLARSLYASVEIDAEIPVEHFKAVAQIIGFIMRQRSKS